MTGKQAGYFRRICGFRRRTTVIHANMRVLSPAAQVSRSRPASPCPMSSPPSLLMRLRTHAGYGWRRARVAYRTANRYSHHLLGAMLTGLVLLYFLFCTTVIGLRYLVL